MMEEEVGISACGWLGEFAGSWQELDERVGFETKWIDVVDRGGRVNDSRPERQPNDMDACSPCCPGCRSIPVTVANIRTDRQSPSFDLQVLFACRQHA